MVHVCVSAYIRVCSMCVFAWLKILYATLREVLLGSVLANAHTRSTMWTLIFVGWSISHFSCFDFVVCHNLVLLIIILRKQIIHIIICTIS